MASSSSSTGPAERNGITKKFPQFDVATDGSDHKYAASKREVASGSSLYKAITKEWKILQDNLPESIYVRVYETRMELMRAVIVGPPGTPYHDGLFFFDILFPPDYPNRPPSVKYWSFGYRLNPNLYVSGKVCLSLLNTWTGKGNEKWIPKKSTMLQLLVSLEGLVLNEMPYFNEPNIVGTQKLARDYNVTAFVLSCKTMLCLLKNPLRNFESLISEHFRDRSRTILNSCQAYMNGFVVVGKYRDGQGFLKKPVRVEERFRTELGWCYNGLADALKKNDPSLEEFVNQLNQLAETRKREYERRKQEKRDKSVIGRAIKMVKKIVTIKKSKKTHKTGKVEQEAAI